MMSRPVLYSFLFLFWCSYMGINVSVQYNGRLLPDLILVDLM